MTFARVLEKLAQFKRTCVDTGHDFADENGIWVSTKITAKERDEAKGGGAETSRRGSFRHGNLEDTRARSPYVPNQTTVQQRLAVAAREHLVRTTES